MDILAKYIYKHLLKNPKKGYKIRIKRESLQSLFREGTFDRREFLSYICILNSKEEEIFKTSLNNYSFDCYHQEANLTPYLSYDHTIVKEYLDYIPTRDERLVNVVKAIYEAGHINMEHPLLNTLGIVKIVPVSSRTVYDTTVYVNRPEVPKEQTLLHILDKSDSLFSFF